MKLASRKAVSYSIGVVLMVALAISVIALAIATSQKWWRGQSQFSQMDTSDSRVYMDQNGNCKLTIAVRNSGTTVLKIARIAIETKLGSQLWVVFNADAPTVQLTDRTPGELVSSNPQRAYIQGQELFVESGQTASLTFPSSGEWDGSKYFEIGKRYMCTVYAGGEVTLFSISVEATGK